MKLAPLLVVLVAAAASAERRPRVVLDDPDPELAHALVTALGPWADVVVGRRDAEDARFVIWRERDELVVEDRANQRTERRAVPEGAFDPVSGAATALTVKTMLRLESTPPDVALASEPSLRLALAGGAVASSAPTARAEVAAAIAPWDGVLRFGLAAMVTGDASIDSAGFKGTWSTWAVAATASYAFVRERWELEPAVALGVSRGALQGEESSVARSEHATLLRLRGGAIGRYRLGRFAVGLDVGFVASPGASRYLKQTGMAEIFTPPAAALELGLVVSCDLFGSSGH